MNNHPLQYSISLFEQMCDDLPPLFPKEEQEAIQHALGHVKKDADITSDQLDDTIIVFGKKLWPYQRAFQEFSERVERHRGNEFFEAHVREYPELYEWFKAWQYGGGHVAELFCGKWKHVGALTAGERVALCHILAEARRDIRHAAITMVAGQERAAYERLIIEFRLLLEAIEEQLNHLRTIANDEQEHPQLAAELREQIRGFERGLALLEPHTTLEEVCSARERMHWKRAELSMA